MENSRWQSAANRQSIEICGIYFAIDPDLQAKSALVRILQRAVADAMNLVAYIGQLSRKVSTDESLDARNPNTHAAALCALPAGLENSAVFQSQALESVLSPAE